MSVQGQGARRSRRARAQRGFFFKKKKNKKKGKTRKQTLAEKQTVQKMESCWSYVLSGQPESDDKQQEILGTLSTSVLFDKFVSFPTPSAERRERFQLYLVRELCVPAQSSAAVVHWLEFAYLGNLSTFAPASWILAAASVPFSKALRDAVLLVSGVRALDVLETWTRVWLSVEVTGHTDHTDHTDHMTLRDAVASAFHVSVDLLAALDENVLRVLETWLTGAAREYCASDASRSWYQSSEARDRCFDALGLWMRGEWACAMPGTHASRIMPFVKPVPLVDLLRFEDAIGVSLPFDLRRFLLEVGDAGEALFAVKLLDAANVPGGYWRWTSRVDFRDEQDPGLPGALGGIATDPLEGCQVLGAGGGGDSTSLLLVLNGPCRGQVWVCDVADEGERERGDMSMAIMPLRASLWASLPTQFAEARSDLYMVLCYSSGVRQPLFRQWCARAPRAPRARAPETDWLASGTVLHVVEKLKELRVLRWEDAHQASVERDVVALLRALEGTPRPPTTDRSQLVTAESAAVLWAAACSEAVFRSTVKAWFPKQLCPCPSAGWLSLCDAHGDAPLFHALRWGSLQVAAMLFGDFVDRSCAEEWTSPSRVSDNRCCLLAVFFGEALNDQPLAFFRHDRYDMDRRKFLEDTCAITCVIFKEACRVLGVDTVLALGPVGPLGPAGPGSWQGCLLPVQAARVGFLSVFETVRESVPDDSRWMLWLESWACSTSPTDAPHSPLSAAADACNPTMLAWLLQVATTPWSAAAVAGAMYHSTQSDAQGFACLRMLCVYWRDFCCSARASSADCERVYKSLEQFCSWTSGFQSDLADAMFSCAGVDGATRTVYLSHAIRAQCLDSVSYLLQRWPLLARCASSDNVTMLMLACSFESVAIVEEVVNALLRCATSAEDYVAVVATRDTRGLTAAHFAARELRVHHLNALWAPHFRELHRALVDPSVRTCLTGRLSVAEVLVVALHDRLSHVISELCSWLLSLSGAAVEEVPPPDLLKVSCGTDLFSFLLKDTDHVNVLDLALATGDVHIVRTVLQCVLHLHGTAFTETVSETVPKELVVALELCWNSSSRFGLEKGPDPVLATLEQAVWVHEWSSFWLSCTPDSEGRRTKRVLDWNSEHSSLVLCVALGTPDLDGPFFFRNYHHDSFVGPEVL
jgi:hypothetical protein